MRKLEILIVDYTDTSTLSRVNTVVRESAKELAKGGIPFTYYSVFSKENMCSRYGNLTIIRRGAKIYSLLLLLWLSNQFLGFFDCSITSFCTSRTLDFYRQAFI